MRRGRSHGTLHDIGQRESHGNMRGRVIWKHEGGVTCDGNTC